MQNELYLEWSSFCKKFLFLMNDFYWIIYHHTEWLWCPWLGRFWSSGPRSAWSWSDAWSLWPLGSVINSICSYCSSCGLSPFSYPPVCVHYTWIFHLTSVLVSYQNVLRGFSFKFTSYLWTRCTVSFNYGLLSWPCLSVLPAPCRHVWQINKTLPSVLYVHIQLHYWVKHTFPINSFWSALLLKNPWLGMTFQLWFTHKFSFTCKHPPGQHVLPVKFPCQPSSWCPLPPRMPHLGHTDHA